MEFTYNDGGRKQAGFKGNAGDCVCRSIAIVSGIPYKQVYEALAEGNAKQRKTKRSTKSTGKRTAREGIDVKRKWFKDYMRSIGFEWTPTMLVGQGCKVHLDEKELPKGRLVVALSKHYTAVLDGVIHDTYNPQRGGGSFAEMKDGVYVSGITSERCVYGYWTFK